jgi:hypothetical protein
MSDPEPNHLVWVDKAKHDLFDIDNDLAPTAGALGLKPSPA